MRLNAFWADHGCLLWQPHNVQVGAGTMNPATVLRVLGPEPWNVAYVEPSVRPDDGRFGENPNRWQQYYQYQVILKPDPGNPQELYLDSLRALGIDTAAHDVRFVEDNWESPALGAWGLGWEVWLDGQEISQYTYFQQAGGLNLDPVSVEITYGIERIVMVLQGVRGFGDIRWADGITYGDLLLRGEVEHCTYNFEVADIERLQAMYDLYEAEARAALARGLVLPAHDYVLKCSHVFNVLDARGAVGVTERARYFVRMREQAREVAQLYLRQREEEGFPLCARRREPIPAPPQVGQAMPPTSPGPYELLLEIGCEELPVADLDRGLEQLEALLSKALCEARLPFDALRVSGTPRRLVAQVAGLPSAQLDQERVVKGPPARVAYDEEGRPTRAAEGFARSQGVPVAALQRRELEGREYVVAVVVDEGRNTVAVLADLLPQVIAGLQFSQSMRWNASGASFARPLRWLVALLDDRVIPFHYAGVTSGRTSRGLRPAGSPEVPIASAGAYVAAMADADVVLDVAAREAMILDQAERLAAEVEGRVDAPPDLLREVANLVERPLAIRGAFAEEYLCLPEEVLLAVMRKHQRYLPLLREGRLLPAFIAVANGVGLDVDAVRHGNEEVLRARYADAAYFYEADTAQPLSAYTPRLATLTFQERLGSMLDKVRRLERLAAELSDTLGLGAAEREAAVRAAALCKSDLATQLVVELTSLQGIMGQHYAERSGEPAAVAQAIAEHYLPRALGDSVPESMPGIVVGLADRLDTLVGLFAVDMRPSGAADPWGLRRAALGLLQILLGKELSLSLPKALSLAAEGLPVEAGEEVRHEVLQFIVGRLRGLLAEAGYRHDVIEAVLAERGHDPILAQRTAAQLAACVARKDWREVLDAYARCVRISRDQQAMIPLDEEQLTEPAERALLEAYRAAAARVSLDADAGTLADAVREMVPAIRRFFDEVLVMTEDTALRNNRLALLQRIGALAEGIADLSLLEGF